MFQDVKSSLNDPRNQNTFQGINFNELLYADDTLLIAKRARVATKYLHLVEAESNYLHLKLNQDNCAFISCNSNGSSFFSNGLRMQTSEDISYLGIHVTKKSDPTHEIRKRISATMAVLKKLDMFWLNTRCSKKCKLLVYDACITSKLLYGLETLEPTQGVAQLLNTFQLKGHRNP